MEKENTLTILDNFDIKIIKLEGNDYLSLTDIAKIKYLETKDVMRNRMCNFNTLEFLGLWEK